MKAGAGTRGDIFDKIRDVTEALLTARRRRLRRAQERERNRGAVRSWVTAFFWAAGVVLLVNQYFVQAYQIPSGSMIDTLLIGDRLFVNKLVYGPEALPGLGKLPGPFKPERNNIIIFESPEYLSRGPVFDIAQRIIFMLTLSLVDIDRDANGNPRPHFLIKREAGTEGDCFFNVRGDMYIRFKGETRKVSELEYNRKRGLKHNLTRLVPPEAYPALIAEAKLDAFGRLGVRAPEFIREEAARTDGLPDIYTDRITQREVWWKVLRGAHPQDSRMTAQYYRYALGWYVPEGRVLPLGDNRDNSQDGRYFGPVQKRRVLGKALLIFYPGQVTQPSGRTKTGLSRVGPVR